MTSPSGLCREAPDERRKATTDTKLEAVLCVERAAAQRTWMVLTEAFLTLASWASILSHRSVSSPDRNAARAPPLPAPAVAEAAADDAGNEEERMTSRKATTRAMISLPLLTPAQEAAILFWSFPKGRRGGGGRVCICAVVSLPSLVKQQEPKINNLKLSFDKSVGAASSLPVVNSLFQRV
jgi:hypothetical protein